MLQKHLTEIQNHSHGMDVVIISVTSEFEKAFWKERLGEMRGQIVKRDALILTVYEDWEKGAGNALGTLYAFKKACEVAIEKYKIDLVECLENNQSIAIYHTAGKGTRLFPMTGCEYNSKSKIQLPGQLFYKSTQKSITILEVVIKQTSILAPYRKGRLSVFWGDQIFFPSENLNTTPHEIDLLIKPISQKPSQKEWEEKGYEKYGFVVADPMGRMKQLEKLSYEDFSNLVIHENEFLAFSLGSFSLSKKMLDAFLKEFSIELQEKKGSLDSDPHLWMPLSLEKDFYLKIMKKKGLNLSFYQDHYERMQAFKKQFSNQKNILLGSSSMGDKTLWFDYGNLASYYENNLKLIEHTEEGSVLRQFFSLEKTFQNSTCENGLTVENSLIINSHIRSGKIKDSILINVTADQINSYKSVILNSSTQKIEANESIIYNCVENGKIALKTNQIRADNFSRENGHIKLYHKIYSDLLWDTPAHGNPFSFQTLYQMNQQVNPSQGQQLATIMHHQIKQALLDLQK